jgi:hypothetical protein
VRSRLATIETSQVLRKLGSLTAPEFQVAQIELQSVFSRP